MKSILVWHNFAQSAHIVFSSSFRFLEMGFGYSSISISSNILQLFWLDLQYHRLQLHFQKYALSIQFWRRFLFNLSLSNRMIWNQCTNVIVERSICVGVGRWWCTNELILNSVDVQFIILSNSTGVEGRREGAENNQNCLPLALSGTFFSELIGMTMTNIRNTVTGFSPIT